MIRVVPDIDVSYLDNILLDKDGEVKMIGASEIIFLPQDHLSVWCVRNAVYQFPLAELIGWLKGRINGRRAIEICAGKARVGKYLGIPMTDSYMQTRPDIAQHYRTMRQEPITPPDDVEKLEALEAVKKYKPEVVIGTFVTHKWKEGMAEGNMYGPEEEEILNQDHVQEYIHVGNMQTHGAKPLLKRDHEELAFPWLISRSFERELNRVMIWSK